MTAGVGAGGVKAREGLRRNSCSHEFCSHLDENVFNINPASKPSNGEVTLNGSGNECCYVFMKQNSRMTCSSNFFFNQ